MFNLRLPPQLKDHAPHLGAPEATLDALDAGHQIPPALALWDGRPATPEQIRAIADLCDLSAARAGGLDGDAMLTRLGWTPEQIRRLREGGLSYSQKPGD